MPPKPKKTSDQYHLRRSEVPKADTAFQNAVNIHTRTLCRLPRSSDVPRLPTPAMKQDFENRFGPATNLNELRAQLRNAPVHHEATHMVDQLRQAIATESGTIANSIRRVKDSFHKTMFSAVLLAGLKAFCPDFLGSPDSLYNQAHELVAVQTFQVVASTFGYVHLAVDLTKVQNVILIQEYYRSFVFSYLANLAKGDLIMPGALQKSIKDGNAYRRRQTLADHRWTFLKKEGFPSRTLRLLADVECHSDDEGPVHIPQPTPTNPGAFGTVYHIVKPTCFGREASHSVRLETSSEASVADAGVVIVVASSHPKMELEPVTQGEQIVDALPVQGS
ncbi:hypothetical protein B0H15DRAFT_988438 [Mycena belliarum]|uniref:Uncharacterized protein n=1 Tax=Mycena belliarum TaxID=1033014 RepID=A0AAD6XMS6_9AGAR|nr:hypothetical protein B0H15DRAFT_988438 [Mycena belliae]